MQILSILNTWYRPATAINPSSFCCLRLGDSPSLGKSVNACAHVVVTDKEVNQGTRSQVVHAVAIVAPLHSQPVDNNDSTNNVVLVSQVDRLRTLEVVVVIEESCDRRI